MNRFAIAILSLCVVSFCPEAYAQQVSVGHGLSLTATALRFTDSEARDVIGDAIGLTLEKVISRNDNRELSVRAGFLKASESLWYGDSVANVDMKIVPLMMVHRSGRAIESGAGGYSGVGAGIIRLSSSVSEGQMRSSGSETDFGLSIFGGMRFGPSAFAELGYLWGDRPGNTGITLSAGARF